jgi:Bacterial nucleoid DNA-binding protein
MLKSNLVSSIHEKYPSLNPNEIESISNLFFKKIILALQEGKKIEIRGFGTLAKKINKAKL